VRPTTETELGRRGRLGDDGEVGAVAGLDRGCGAAGVVADLLADDGGELEVALQPDAGAAQRDGGVGLGEHTGLHVPGAAAEHAAVDEVAGERVGLRPRGGVADGHDVDVPVEDERPPAARAGDRRARVVAARLDRDELDVGARLGVHGRHEPRHLALAPDEVVVRLAGVLRLDARDAHGALQRVHELAREGVDFCEDAVL
jgi:hypothetical protein